MQAVLRRTARPAPLINLKKPLKNAQKIARKMFAKLLDITAKLVI